MKTIAAAMMTATLAVLAGFPATAASISEPATVFYGQVLGAGSDQPFLVTEGELVWTIRRADGVEVTLSENLFPLRGGEFSYRLDVPHTALALGLAPSANNVPLGTTEQTHTHWQILINGLPARILGPGDAEFHADQALRTATYRLDLEVAQAAPDSDGDGIPDWWEKRFGQDDAAADGDGDGWTNLDEFNQGGKPDRDDRSPSLATRELLIYADGTTGLRLQAIDADSGPDDLVYTLEALPALGTLYLRNAVAGGADRDQALGVGDTFTQTDIDGGRLILVQTEATLPFARLQVSLHDEDPAHDVFHGTVLLQLYRPGPRFNESRLALALADLPARLPTLPGLPGEEQQRVINYLLSRDLGYVIWDAARDLRGFHLAMPSAGLTPDEYQTQYLPDYGPDRSHVLRGGLGPDQLEGGMENDFLIGGRGNDTLRGHGGSDVFVLLSPQDGNDTLADFSLADGDALDISRVLRGTSSSLSDYVQITTDGTDSMVGIDVDGDGGTYTDLVLTVRGPELAAADLYDLVDNGQLRPGDRVLPPRISIVAIQPDASENGPRSGRFAVSRSGNPGDPLTVDLTITGSAENGVDYRLLAEQVDFAAGQRVVALAVDPNEDALTELNEIVEVSILPGADYTVGTPDRAVVTIEDLAPQLSVEALEPVAVQNPVAPGVFLIARSGVMDRSLLVRLDVGGTAANGSDYDRIPAFVTLPAFQSFALIEVRPNPTAALAGPVSVELTLQPDASYLLLPPSRARVLIVPERLSLADWRARHFPGAAGDLLAFAAADFGQAGVRNLFRYAFGLDALDPMHSRGRPEFRVRDGHLTVEFRRPGSVTDVQFYVEVSEDLRTWNDGDEFIEQIEPDDPAVGPDTMCYRARRSLSEAQRQFMRVRVGYNP